MDTTVRPNLSNRWGVTDLLERSVCSIVRDPHDQFWIVLTIDELPRMVDVLRGPFEAIDGAMTAIGKNLHGSCRHGAAVRPANYFP
ncbi:hypothetical protein [Bosea sp. TAF32]|uniref:hypothetical protein n=1 Tax=Bosea sp. TAF32 TaxID=3237482 RepID=UPI003F93DE50